MPLSYLFEPVEDIYIFSNSLINYLYHFSAWKKDVSYLIAASGTGSTEKFFTSVYESPNILNSSAGRKNNMQYKLYNDIRKEASSTRINGLCHK